MGGWAVRRCPESGAVARGPDNCLPGGGTLRSALPFGGGARSRAGDSGHLLAHHRGVRAVGVGAVVNGQPAHRSQRRRQTVEQLSSTRRDEPHERAGKPTKGQFTPEMRKIHRPPPARSTASSTARCWSISRRSSATSSTRPETARLDRRQPGLWSADALNKGALRVLRSAGLTPGDRHEAGPRGRAAAERDPATTSPSATTTPCPCLLACSRGETVSRS